MMWKSKIFSAEHVAVLLAEQQTAPSPIYFKDADVLKPGLQLLKQHKYAEALQSWEQIPEDSAAKQFNLSQLYGVVGEQQKALQSMQNACAYGCGWLTRQAYLEPLKPIASWMTQPPQPRDACGQ